MVLSHWARLGIPNENQADEGATSPSEGKLTNVQKIQWNVSDPASGLSTSRSPGTDDYVLYCGT